VTISILVPLGIASKFYQGPGKYWCIHYFGDIVYVIFWSMVLFLFYPRIRPLVIVSIVITVTSVIEFSQLLDNGLLSWMRHSFIGRSLVGDTFSAYDFIYYGIGSIIAFGWMLLIQCKFRPFRRM